jgi:hypothetical protein
MADYRIEPDGTAIILLIATATRQTYDENHPARATRFSFRSKHEIADFVQAGESHGFTFDGKEFLPQTS